MSAYVLNNPYEAQRELAKLTGNYNNNVSVSEVLNEIQQDTADLKSYHNELGKHVLSEKYNILDQNALYTFSKNEHERLDTMMKTLKNQKSLNDRRLLLSRSTTSSLQTYTTLLVSLLIFIAYVSIIYNMKNSGIISEAVLTILLAVGIVVISIYMVYKVRDHYFRDNIDYSKYNFTVPDELKTPLDVSVKGTDGFTTRDYETNKYE